MQSFVYDRLKISGMPNKFNAWLHFITMGQNKVKYNICAEDVMPKDGNPTKILIWITRKMEVICFLP